jgi:hypothetical protein
MGYSAEMAVEKGYRDSRINRIFEGTNEINRLLVVDTAMKRAMKGDFNLSGKAEEAFNNLIKITDGKKPGENYYEEKLRYINNFKKAILIAIHGASKAFEKKMVEEQEVLNNISNMMISTYVAESLALRVQKIESLKGNVAAAVYRDMLDVYVYDAADLIRKEVSDAIYSFASAEQAPALVKAMTALTTVTGINVKACRRRIADKLIEDNSYKF